MRPTNKLFLFALISFFGTVPVVHAFDLASVTVTPVTCNGAIVDGTIEATEEADYYSVVLVAGQKFTIDVDTFDQGGTLDTLLEVYVHPETETIIALNDKSSDDPLDEDPYVAITVDAGGTYYLRIYDSTLNGNTGAYTLTLKCSDQTAPSEFTWPVVVGDLLGATGSKPGSLINITPANAGISLPFPLGVGPIVDIEFDPTGDFVFVAVDTAVSIDDAVAVDAAVAAVAVEDIPAKIVALDPKVGNEVKSYSLETESVVALETAGNELYGVQVDPDSEKYSLVLVTFDDSDPTDPKATLTPVFPFGTQQVRALAYHSVEKVIYGVASIVSKSDLIKIHLEPELLVETTSAIPIVDETTGEPVNVVSLDFSHENVLFGVDLSGNLHEINHITGQAVSIGDDPIVGVSSLTFVVGVPQDVDPIKTLCSSTLTTSASASSETAAPKLSRLKLKNNPLHRAIGLFKFQGIEGETVTLNITAEEEESAAAVAEESSVNERDNPWLNWKGKGRVFLGIRDSIPDLDFRARKKDQLPLTLSATLPANGTYYVILIRPLLRFYQTDYCVTLESDNENSEAWKSFDVAWPSDDSDDDTASTSAAEPEDVQKSTETVASPSADDGPVPVALSTTAVNEPAAEGADPEVGQTDGGDTTVEKLVEVTVEEPVETDPVGELR